MRNRHFLKSLFLSALLLAATALVITAATAMPSRAATLDIVKKRGQVICGVSQGLPGFSNPDDSGAWRGIDVDFCRAVAAAIFGDVSRAKFVPMSSKVRFTALQSGEVDLLTRNTTWSMHRDTGLGIDFVGVNFYDGQGFMVRRDLSVTSALELSGASLCTNAGTTTELSTADYFRKHNMNYEINTFENANESVIAYDAGRCDVYTTDHSGLYAQRLKLKQPEAHIILPEIISKEPLGPVVREGDNQWSDIIRWVHFATLAGEELGVSSQNISALAGSDNPSIRRFLGEEGGLGKNLGLSADWASNIIRLVGNYAEIYDRNVGKDSPLNIARGWNHLWINGGLHYAPPIR